MLQIPLNLAYREVNRLIIINYSIALKERYHVAVANIDKKVWQAVKKEILVSYNADESTRTNRMKVSIYIKIPQFNKIEAVNENVVKILLHLLKL